jgi:hypothetical protein
MTYVSHYNYLSQFNCRRKCLSKDWHSSWVFMKTRKCPRMDIYSIGVGLDDVAKDDSIRGMQNPIYNNVYDSMLSRF